MMFPWSTCIVNVLYLFWGATYGTYTDEVVVCAPLTGDYFVADAQRVHQIVKSYTQGESAEEWIRGISRFRDGRRDIKALKAHFQGEGNSSRRIAQADSLYRQANWHYLYPHCE
jgi:hypothetical protein